MKQSLLIFLLLTLFCSFAFAEELDRFLISPGVSVGTLTSSTTELNLVEMFGVENVKSTTIQNDQKDTITETVLYPFDTLRMLYINWKDGDSHNGISSVIIKGHSSYWHTREGISLGTSLIQLEIMNGTYFHLTGLNLEHPSTAVDCGNGVLKSLGYRDSTDTRILGKRMILQLDQPYSILERITDEEYTSISKEGIFRSDITAMEKLNPIVRQMEIFFTP